MIDLEAARRYLRKLLGKNIEITDPAVLDAAAAVVVKGKGAKP
jgi:hypothetical protein